MRLRFTTSPFCLFALLCFYVLLIPTPAAAYLDPVTGSILIQGIVGGVVAVVVFFRKTVARGIRSFRSRGAGEAKEEAPEHASGDPEEKRQAS